MKKITLFFSAFMLTVATTFAQTWDIGYPIVGGVTATLSDSTLTISGTGEMQDFAMGTALWFSSINDIKVVKIENGVTNIGSYAFYACSKLASVSIANSIVSINSEAFSGCSKLASITIPSNVTSIGEKAFSGCSKLASVNIPIKVTSIEKSVFYECSALATVTLSDSVNSIGDDAFFGCSALTSISIPQKVKSIGDNAFSGCSGLTLITVLNPVPVNILSNVFDNVNKNTCTLKTPLNVLPDYKAANVWKTFNNIAGEATIGSPTVKNVTAILCNDTLTISGTGGMQNFSNKTVAPWRNSIGSIKSVVIKESVTGIGDSAFFNCSALTSVQIAKTVTKIGNAVFSGCSNLALISALNPTPVTVNANVFNGVNKNTCAIKLPINALTNYRKANEWKDFLNITGESFIGYPDAQDVIATLDGNILSINGTGEMQDYLNASAVPWYDKDNSDVTSVVIQDGITNIGDKAFMDCKKLTSISIPESVTKIGSRAFLNCSRLALVVLPDVTEIGEYAFANCEILTSINLPESITSIGDRAFSGCSSLNSVNLPSNITRIGVGLFATCSSLTSIIIPEGVDSIGFQAFAYCSNLKWVVIPSTVTTIENFAFTTCSALTSITALNSTPVKIFPDVFYNVNKNTCVLRVNENAIAKYKAADVWKEFVNVTVSVGVVEAEPALIVGYYSILGQKLPKEPQSGVYIIVYDNGKTEKVLK